MGFPEGSTTPVLGKEPYVKPRIDAVGALAEALLGTWDTQEGDQCRDSLFHATSL